MTSTEVCGIHRQSIISEIHLDKTSKGKELYD